MMQKKFLILTVTCLTSVQVFAACDRNLHIGNDTIRLCTTRGTRPSLNINIKGTTYYANMSSISRPMNSNTTKKFNIMYNDMPYYVYDNGCPPIVAHATDYHEDCSVKTCGDGYVLNDAGSGCTCPAGNYIDSMGLCTACAIGFYNNNENATSCTQCPDGWTTLETGTKSEDGCILEGGSD